MYPVYGLAEASVAVSFPEPGAPARSVLLDRHQLGVSRTPALLPPGSTDAVALMSVGRAIPHCELRIADDADTALADGSVGHIQIRGGNVTRGYFQNPDANAALYLRRWLAANRRSRREHRRSLYVTGRAKEIIFVNGQNYYPHDLEDIAIRAGEELELGKVVVSGVRRAGAATDELVVFVLHGPRFRSSCRSRSKSRAC